MNLRYLEGINGAAGARGGLTDFYNMLQTGLVDAGMLWPEAAATFKISEVAPYMLRADLGAVNSKTVTVNKDCWDKLPDEVKGVLLDVAVEYRDHLAGLAMDRAASSETKWRHHHCCHCRRAGRLGRRHAKYRTGMGRHAE